MNPSTDTPGEHGTHFPTVYWPQWKCRASFYASSTIPDVDPSALFAVLGFVFKGDLVVLANIKDRGYCIPSGKIEPNEEPLAAMLREAYEEAGAVLEPHTVHPIGWYKLIPADVESPERICPVFLAEADSFTDVPADSESIGTRLATLDEVSTLYFFWDDLMAAVFKYADQVRTRKR